MTYCPYCGRKLRATLQHEELGMERALAIFGGTKEFVPSTAELGACALGPAPCHDGAQALVFVPTEDVFGLAGSSRG